MKACVFCESLGSLTGEHVFGNWVSSIGLEFEAVAQEAGPLNRIGRSLGITTPFRQKVRDVCGECNHGWMSRLEMVAKRVLTPLILGNPAQVDSADQGAIAAWLQKTALVAMLVSSEDDRAQGYGLPKSEYHALYALRDSVEPLPDTQVWIGRIESQRRTGAVRVTPLVVAVEGVDEPEWPQAYVMTLVLGRLLIQGIRFTTPKLQLDVTQLGPLARIWPETTDAVRVEASLLQDSEFLALTNGRSLRVDVPHTSLRPWRSATELPPSRAIGRMVELPTICGQHVVYYPRYLVEEAFRGRYVAFTAACACGTAYLIQTQADGAHCKEAGSPEFIQRVYHELPGDEYVFEGDSGQFVCKRRTSEAVQAESE